MTTIARSLMLALLSLVRVGAIAIAAVSLILLLGCDQSEQTVQLQLESQSSQEKLVHSNSSPRAILDRCAQRYQSLKSYQDAAIVRLTYRSEGQTLEDQAPMALAWKSPDLLGLRVYGLTAGPNAQGRWHLHLGKSYPELGQQILSRRIPDRVNFSWLLSDPLVAESLSAGLGGFPPQLDLLMSPAPLSRLADESAAISLHPTQSIDGQLCWIVRVSRGSWTYHLWIDQASHLLRRLELPTELLPQEILSDPSISDLRLTIDLTAIQIDSPIDWSNWQVPRTAQDQLVTHFVPPRPSLDTRYLGKQIPAFQLKGPDGDVVFDSTTNDHRQAAVLLWLADHPACLAAAEQMSVAAMQLKQAGIDDRTVQFVPIWAETQPPTGYSFTQLKQSWGLPGQIALDRDAAGRDLFQVNEAPTVVILDRKGQIQFWDVRLNPNLDRALAPLISRVIEGVDLASDLLQSQNSAEVRVQAELSLATAADADSSQRGQWQSYPPESIRLTQVSQQQFGSIITGLIQDSRERIWTLLANGTLHLLGTDLKSIQQTETDWTNRHIQELQLSTDGRYCAALMPQHGIGLLDIQAQECVHFDLSENEHPIDMNWLVLGHAQTPRLAVITNQQRVLLLDPQNREPLSGTCPAEPVAILVDPSNSGASGLIILQTGAMESLSLPDDSSSAGTQVSSSITPHQRLTFKPAAGPWRTVVNSKKSQAAASGWVAEDEPTLFFLDQRLNPFWSCRLPFVPGSHALNHLSAAISPGNGEIVWAALDATGTLHLMRPDVAWHEHFRIGTQPSSTVLIREGDSLSLIVAAQSTLTAYRLE